MALVGTYVLGAAGCKGGADGLALIAAPSGPGVVEPREDGSYFTTLRIGEPLDFAAHATANNSDDGVTLTIDVTGGTLTAAEAGFVSEFPIASGGGAASRSIEVVGTAAAFGTIELTATARSAGTTAAWTLTIRINTPPSLSPSDPGRVGGSAPAFTTTVLLGEPLDFTVVATDPDDEQRLTITAEVTGGTLTAQQAGFVTALPAEVDDEAPMSPSLTIEGTAAAMGTIEFTLSVSDGWESDSWTLTIRITTRPQIGAPTGPGVVTDGPVDYTATVAAFEPLDFTIEATDADATALLTFEATVTGGTLTPAEAGFATAFPVSDSGNSSVVLAFTGSALTTAGTLELTFTVDDSYGNVVHITVTVVVEAEAPQFTNAPPLGADPGIRWRYTPEASGRPSPTFTASGYPNWMTWNGTTLSGTPGPADLPTAVITITASNGIAPDAILTFAVKVNEWHLEVSGEHILGVWADSPLDVFAVGYEGIIMRSDGTDWKLMESGTTINLSAIWGATSDNVHAVGWSGTILHFDGSTWTGVSSPTTRNFLSIHGREPADVHASTGQLGVTHFDGTTWTVTHIGTSGQVRAVWAFVNSPIVVGIGRVGANGGIWTYDGTTWASHGLQSTPELYGVWAESTAAIYAVGNNGAIRHFDGTAWHAMASGTSAWLTDIWGNSATNMFAVGEDGTIIHFDGSTWSPMTFGPTYGALNSVWGTSSSNVYAVGFYGSNAHYDGTSWSTMWLPTARAMMTSASGPADDVYTVNEVGDIYHFDGTEWSVAHTTSGGFSNVWRATPSNVIAVGDDGRIEHFDGSSWTSRTSGTVENLNDAWGLQTVAYAVGDNGTILSGNYTTWSSMASPTSSDLNAVYGTAADNVFAVGDGGAIVRYNGTTWSNMSSGATTRLHSVWAASADNVFAVGEDGTILHYNGTAWTTMTSGTTEHLHSIHGRAADDVYAVGDNGTILRYDGTTWHTLPAPITRPFQSILVDADSASVFITSNTGFIFRYGP